MEGEPVLSATRTFKKQNSALVIRRVIAGHVSQRFNVRFPLLASADSPHFHLVGHKSRDRRLLRVSLVRGRKWSVTRKTSRVVARAALSK